MLRPKNNWLVRRNSIRKVDERVDEISSGDFRFDLAQERIFKEFYSHTFPSEYMSFRAFCEAVENKLMEKEKLRIQGYFRAFDTQQNFYLTYTDYLLGSFTFIVKERSIFVI